jgi:hypothetical protein
VWLFGDRGSAGAAGIEMRGDTALVRRSSKTGSLDAVALFGEHATLAVDGLTFAATGAAEFVQRAGEWVVNGAGRVNRMSGAV